jgi:hypothetical protein
MKKKGKRMGTFRDELNSELDFGQDWVPINIILGIEFNKGVPFKVHFRVAFKGGALEFLWKMLVSKKKR